MKKNVITIIIVTLCLLPNLLKSQCYTILSVKGEIIIEKTGQPIKEMDEICSTDKLIFSNKESKASVLSPEQGRYIIKLSDKKKNNELIAFVNSVLFQGNVKLSTKGIATLDEEFGDNYLIIGSSKVIIDVSDFPMDKNNYFCLKYIFDGNIINKVLKYNKDTLFIDKSAFGNEGKAIDAGKVENVNLYYYNKEKNISKNISTFNLMFADETVLKNEMTNYINILKMAGKDNLFIKQEVSLYLNDVYGNVNSEDINNWLGINFGLK